MTNHDERRRDVTDAGVALSNPFWFSCGLDFVLALFLVPVGAGLITGWVDGMNFRTIPDGWFGLLFLTHGLWSLYTSVCLILEDGSTRCSLGAHRHRIGAAISAVVALFLWLAVLLDSIIYSPRVFEMGLGAIIFATIICGSIGSLLLVIARRMEKIKEVSRDR